MRFHHSTRRGRNRFSQGGNHHSAHGGTKFGAATHSSSLSSRWAQLSYCRQTNIHFNRRVPVELPDEMRERTLARTSSGSILSQTTTQQNDETMLVGCEQGILQNGRLASCNHNQSQLLMPDAASSRHLNQFDQLSLSPESHHYSANGNQTGPHHHQHHHQHHHNHHQRHNSVRSNRSSREDTPNVDDHRHQHNRQAALTTSKSIEKNQQEAENSKPDTTALHTPSDPPKSKKLDLEKAREKLIAQVDKHPFWSTKAAKRMRLLDIHERQIYIYELTSYCEKRDLEWRYEAYRGGKLGSGPFGTSGSVSQGGVLRRAPTIGSMQQQRLPLSGAPSQPPSPAASTPQHKQQQQLTLTPPPPSGETANNSQPYQTGLGQFQTDHTKQSPPAAIENSTAQRPQQFAFDAPFGGLCQTGSFRQRAQPKCPSLSNQNQHQLRRGSSANRLRRSCSSATSSPVHSAPLPGTAVVQSLSSTPVQASPPGSGSGFVSTPPSEPRPMPNADLVWSIEPPKHLRPDLFASYVHTSEVPGTSFVKRCHGCDGRGRLKCTSCYGVGYEVCLSCTGKGSLRSYSSMSAGGGLGPSSGRSGLGSRSGGVEQHTRDQSSGGGITGSMWGNAGDDSGSSSRTGAGGRHDEPGGITSSSSEMCNNCSGVGQKRCWICAGRSFIICTACAGTGSLRCYLNLNIAYTNHRDEMCLNNSDGIIPRDRLKLSSGLLLADEIADRLEPLATTTNKSGANHERQSTGMQTTTENAPTIQSHHHHHQQEQQQVGTSNLEQVVRPGELIQLSVLSAKLLDKHWQTYKHERFIKQRHRVTQIECSKIDWEFRKKRGHFVVYGDEQKVYIAKYPFKSICNIT